MVFKNDLEVEIGGRLETLIEVASSRSDDGRCNNCRVPFLKNLLFFVTSFFPTFSMSYENPSPAPSAERSPFTRRAQQLLAAAAMAAGIEAVPALAEAQVRTETVSFDTFADRLDDARLRIESLRFSRMDVPPSFEHRPTVSLYLSPREASAVNPADHQTTETSSLDQATEPLMRPEIASQHDFYVTDEFVYVGVVNPGDSQDPRTNREGAREVINAYQLTDGAQHIDLPLPQSPSRHLSASNWGATQAEAVRRAFIGVVHNISQEAQQMVTTDETGRVLIVREDRRRLLFSHFSINVEQTPSTQQWSATIEADVAPVQAPAPSGATHGHHRHHH